MNSRTLRIAAFAGLSSLALAACVTDPETGQQRISKSAIGGLGGALGGYLLGDIVGGRRDRVRRFAPAIRHARPVVTEAHLLLRDPEGGHRPALNGGGGRLAAREELAR